MDKVWLASGFQFDLVKQRLIQTLCPGNLLRVLTTTACYLPAYSRIKSILIIQPRLAWL